MLPLPENSPLLFTSANMMSPPPPPGWRSNLSNEDFDTNLVIMLAAFLLAVVIILGLNSVTLCSRRTTVDNFREAMRHPGPAGLKKSDLSQIPVAVYKPGEAISATDCPICLGEFMDGEQVRVLPKCNHGYHVRCIDPWLMAHSACPTCRQPLIDRPLPVPAAMQAVFRSPDNERDQPSTVVVVINC